jgi:uncharacterized DUF497 family protein
MPLRFTFDPAKSAANLAKHGIDFVQAQVLWADEARIDIPVRFTREPRFMVIGRIGGKVWSCVCTNRSEEIRLISCRRARRAEIARYTRH